MDSSQTLSPQSEGWLTFFALVDCSCFYASCEKLLDPRLREHPLIVLSNNDGCVVSRCPAAKRLGILIGTPLFKIKKLIENHQVAMLSSNYELYGDMSSRVMECLRHFSPRIEIYSIDEAFLRLDSSDMPFREWAVSLRQQIRQMSGIEVTVGIGPTKTLAKVASHIAKSAARAEGIFCLNSQAGIQSALLHLPVSELWGIGHRYSRKLRLLNIDSVQQLLTLGEIWMEKHLGGLTGRRLWWELNGVVCSALNPEPAVRRQITYSRSFSNPLDDLGELELVISQYISAASARLRGLRLAAQGMSVFMNTNRHRPNLPQHHPTLHHRFPQETVYTPKLIAAGRALLRAMYRPGNRYIKAGVVLQDICRYNEIAPQLFIPFPRRQLCLMEAVDEVNLLMGRDTLRPASSVRAAHWSMRREMRSARATTRWTELPEVRHCLPRETDESPPEAKQKGHGSD